MSREKREQILALGRLGWSLRRIEQETGVRRETASRYLKAAEIAVRSPRRRLLPSNAASCADGVSTDSAPNAASCADGVSTDPAPNAASCADGVSTDWAPGRSPSASACAAHHEFIERSLVAGRNAMAIYQDLVDDHGFTARYASVKRYVRKLRGQGSTEPRCVISTPAGQEAQVDYGSGPMVRDSRGTYRRTRLFVLTLGYSRKSVRLLCFKSSTRTWAELHERAFRQLGGAPRVVVLDNLREGVISADIYDPALNPLYRDLLAHYGAVALPCRVRDPDRKGKVERAVGHAKQTPLRGLRFDNLEQAQAYLDRWESRWADTRIHGTTKRQVQAMFDEERPELLALPVEPFAYYDYGTRTVHLDGCVEVQAAYYSTPPGFIGKRLHVQWDALKVRLVDPKTGQLLREHIRQRRGAHRIDPRDTPKRKPPSTEALLARAHHAGENIGRLCDAIDQSLPQTGVRRILGVLSLSKKYGAAVTDEACNAALELDSASYRFVKRYLERKKQSAPPLRQIDPLIRELTHYRDVIRRLTEGQTE